MMRSFFRRVRRCDSGATAVEFSIIIWPLILIVLGLFETGRMLWTRSAIEETVTTVARCVAVRQSACATGGVVDLAKTRAHAQAQALVRGVELTSNMITIDTATPCNGATGFGEFAVSYNFSTSFGGFGLVDDTLTMRVAACFPTPTT